MRKVILQCFITVLISVLVCFAVLVASIFFPIDSRKVLIDIKEEDVIGLTSLEIEEKYGKFDCISRSDGKGKDGLYRNTTCGYTKKESESVLFNEWPEWLFFIKFDENGIARGCYEGYRPGG